MATIIIQGTGDAVAEIESHPDPEIAGEGGVQFRCRGCSEVDSDRGNLADTIAAAEVHVDYRCPYRYAD